MNHSIFKVWVGSLLGVSLSFGAVACVPKAPSSSSSLPTSRSTVTLGEADVAGSGASDDPSDKEEALLEEDSTAGVANYGAGTGTLTCPEGEHVTGLAVSEKSIIGITYIADIGVVCSEVTSLVQNVQWAWTASDENTTLHFSDFKFGFDQISLSWSGQKLCDIREASVDGDEYISSASGLNLTNCSSSLTTKIYATNPFAGDLKVSSISVSRQTFLSANYVTGFELKDQNGALLTEVPTL